MKMSMCALPARVSVLNAKATQQHAPIAIPTGLINSYIMHPAKCNAHSIIMTTQHKSHMSVSPVLVPAWNAVEKTHANHVFLAII